MSSRTRTRRHLPAALGGAALTMALLLAGCSAGGTDAGSSVTAAADDEGHGPADVAFAQGMVVHHRGALAMAALAADRASSPEVKELAAAIEAAQQPEIDTMTGWLQAWGEDVPAEASTADGDEDGTHHMDGMDMGDDTMADGMASTQDMAALEAADGADFDRQFLTLMIAHHEGAVAMSRTELDEGQDAAALTLAQQVIDAQTLEITQMQQLLAG